MIPILYTAEELDFTSNGVGRLSDCLSCVVTEERNGIYELEFQYPITGAWYERMITEGGCVGVFHDDNHDLQPFDIYSYSAPINGIVTFYAHHISYRLNKVILQPFTVSSITMLMAQLPYHAVTYCPFEFWTDKVVSAQFKVEHPENCRAILAGQDGSVLDVYGKGEYEFDVFDVKLYTNRGTDSGVTIRYGKNLVDIVKDFDRTGSYNGIAPYWTGEDGTVITLPEIYVLSGDAPAENHAPWTTKNDDEMTDENGTVIEFPYVISNVVPIDFTTEFDDQPTAAQLRQAAEDYLTNNQPWIPKTNIKIDFVALWQTPEYENVAALQRVALCDTVSVYYPELGVTANNQKVIKVEYNVLTERFDSMELGEVKTSLAETVEKAVYIKMEKQAADFGNIMKAAIEHATNLITGGLGGYVVFNLNANGEPQEILIMDTDNINTAVNVIRMNKNGIGFSTTGYNGTYTSAWTIDGRFNADFITTGTLNAGRIKTGVLSDYSGKNSWDMLTGDMHISGKLIQNLFGYNAYNRLALIPHKYLSTSVYPYSLLENTTPGFATYSGSDEDDLKSGVSIYSAVNGATIDYYCLNSAFEANFRQTVHGFKSGEEYLLQFEYRNAYVISLYDITNSVTKWQYRINSEGNIGLYKPIGNSLVAKQYFNETTFAWFNDAQEIELYVTEGLVAIGDRDASTGNHASLYITDSIFGIYCKGTSAVYLRGVSTSTLTYSGSTVQLQSPSSKRYKHDIKALTDKKLDPHKLLKLPVRQFKYNEEVKKPYPDLDNVLLPGFIAEEVDKHYPSAVIHDDEGNIESWDERRIIPGMLALIQEQQKRIEDLEQRLEKLERMVSNLDN